MRKLFRPKLTVAVLMFGVACFAILFRMMAPISRSEALRLGKEHLSSAWPDTDWESKKYRVSFDEKKNRWIVDAVGDDGASRLGVGMNADGKDLSTIHRNIVVIPAKGRKAATTTD